MKNSKNNLTGVVHALSGRRVGIIKLYETLCGKSTGLLWTVADGEPVGCTKCKSMLHGKAHARKS